MPPISDADLKAMARSNNIILCAQLYNRAKDAFRAEQWDRVLDLTEGLAAAPTSHTEHTHLRVRSQTLRTVIFTAQLNAYLELAQAYGQGAAKAADPQVKADDLRLRATYLAAADRAALNLAVTAGQLVADASIHETIPLEASIPPGQDPVALPGLDRVTTGDSLAPAEQNRAVAECLREKIDEVLQQEVSGNMARVRLLLVDGPINISGPNFGLLLARALADGLSLPDSRPGDGAAQRKQLCDAGRQTLSAILPLLGNDPASRKEAEALQSRFSE